MDAVTDTLGAPEDVGRVQEYFKVCLGVKDLSNVEIDELLPVLEAENPIERIAYRQNAKSFTKVLVADFIAGEMQEKDTSFSAQTIDESATAKDSESVIPNNTDAEVVESTSMSHHHGEYHEQAELVEKNNCIIEISPEEKDKRTKDADSSIATLAGANAASVFLGLGFPWTIATICHWAKYGESFLVGKLPTADITFAIVLFLACAVIAFMVLGLGRLIIGGELGGPGVSRILSGIVMFFLWAALVVLNVMNSYGYLGASDIFVPAVATEISAPYPEKGAKKTDEGI